MKNNTERTKQLLVQALQNVPNDFALTEVKFFIKTALQKLEHVEKKRDRREQTAATPHESWWQSVTGNLTNPLTPKHTLDTIDQMIEAEYNKLNELAERKKKKTDDGDADDLQALFG